MIFLVNRAPEWKFGCHSSQLMEYVIDRAGNLKVNMNTMNTRNMRDTGLKWGNHNRPADKERGEDKDSNTQELMKHG